MSARRGDRLAYAVSIYRYHGAVQYDENRGCIGDGYYVPFEIRIYVVLRAEAAGQTEKTRTLELTFPLILAEAGLRTLR